MIVALLLLAPELGVDETIGGGTTVGGESATGSDADGKNEAVALQNYNRFPTYFLDRR
jgi:hypothetical protein